MAEKTVMVMYDDPDGMCRAWARGPASQSGAVDEVAGKMLAAYRIKKAELGDPLATCAYTKRITINDDYDLTDSGSDE